MTRLVTRLAPACLATFLLVSTGCEDKQCQDSLNTCRTELGNLQKTSASHQTAMNELKAQLTQAQAKVDELTKEVEALKSGKGAKVKEEKGKPADEKKAEPAKAEEKHKKEKK
jgi:peptidoglycan hydrolase CwlO-like protein